jgi:hypothetical protein
MNFCSSMFLLVIFFFIETVVLGVISSIRMKLWFNYVSHCDEYFCSVCKVCLDK